MDSFRKEASLTAAVAALNKIQPLLSLDQRCPPPLVADETADAIHQALEGYKKRRLEVAMEAAIAAGETVMTWNIPVTPGTNRSNAIMAAQKVAAQAAKAAAEAATQKYGLCYMDTGAGVGIRLVCRCPIRQILKNRIRGFV